jgi:hypothetical protein
MINILFAVLFALGLITSGGVTVAASQTAAPEDLLYPVRVWSEDARITVADPGTAAELAYQFAEKNMLQIATKLASGEKVEEAQMIRTEYLFEKALQSALNQPDDKAIASMVSIQTRLQKQLSGMEEPVITETASVAIHGRLQTLVETTLSVTAVGITDPVLIRQHDRDRVNDNATSGNQLRSMFHWSQPQDGVVTDAIQSNPWLTETITSTTPYSFSYATPNVDGPRMPAQAGSGPGSGPAYKKP